MVGDMLPPIGASRSELQYLGRDNFRDVPHCPHGKYKYFLVEQRLDHTHSKDSTDLHQKFVERGTGYRIPNFHGVFDKRKFRDWLVSVDGVFNDTNVDPTKQALLVRSLPI
ncbi:hypothetical protein TorRG33x02_232350 [Trema orientale]|uniref:Uncharacterized protein n=1 Tax=Trema orientale TaxID=63057 RepID=A0A2P5E653_TREOI|nr:hypothetical protein TorRG33x02_232350 [Trema orientale]